MQAEQKKTKLFINQFGYRKELQVGAVKGQLQHRKWQKGEKLTRKQAILAQCYVCSGEETGAEDCLGERTCPLYQYFSYKGKRKPKNEGFSASQELQIGV